MGMGIVGRRLMLHGGMSRNSRDGVAMFLEVAQVAIVIGYIGLLFGRMIKAGISRTREALADASAVQFTRQTAGPEVGRAQVGKAVTHEHIGCRLRTEQH